MSKRLTLLLTEVSMGLDDYLALIALLAFSAALGVGLFLAMGSV